MDTALLFLFACGLLGLMSRVSSSKAYLLSIVGAAIVAAVYLNFHGLMQ